MAIISHYFRKLLIGFIGIYASYLSISYLAEKLYSNTHLGSIPNSKRAINSSTPHSLRGWDASYAVSTV